MRPPDMEIRLILSDPGMGWEYVARKRGEVVCASDGEAFDKLAHALTACVDEMRAYATVPPAPTIEEGGDE